MTHSSVAETDNLIFVHALLGNENDHEWADRLEAADVDLVCLDQWEAQKSRFRRQTEKGSEVAISLDRAIQLHDGDVLFWDESQNRAIVARIALNKVMEIDVSALVDEGGMAALQKCVQLGHALGNQHWPAVIKETKVYVPVALTEPVVDSVMRTHALQGISYRFVPGKDVVSQMTREEARRLFGGATQEGEGHTHAPSI